MIPHKILILDNDLEFCDIIQSHFGKRGYSVKIATSTTDAINKLRQSGFDVVILDVDINTRGDGLNVAQIIQAEDIDTNIIVVACVGERDDVVKAINLGVEAWFDKVSLDMRALTENVKELCRVVPTRLMRRFLKVTLA